MRSLSGPTIAALQRVPLPMTLLVEMDLTVPLFLNTSPLNLVISGNTYIGTKRLGKIEPLQDSPSEAKGLRFEMSGVPATHIALARTERVQGKAVRIKTCIFDPDTYQPLDVRLRWAGMLDVFVIEDGAQSATLQVTAEHIGIDLIRPVTSLYSDSEQRRLYSGDPSLQFISDQTEMRIVWPNAAYFKK